LAAGEAQRGNGGCGIFQQPGLEFRLGPSFGYHLRAVVRANFGFVGFNDAVNAGGVDVAFLSEQGFEGSNPNVHFTQSGVIVIVIVVMGWAAQGRLPGWTRSLDAIIAPLTIGGWLQKSVQDRHCGLSPYFIRGVL
jgi:hypothetical protein